MKISSFLKKHKTLIMLFFFLPATTIAQIDQTRLAPTLQGSSQANYYYAKPGDLTILVNIWGHVHRPGRYEVSSSTDLIQLLSLAGGPAESAKLNEVKIIRMDKTNSGIQKREIIINVENWTESDGNDLKLHPGDTILIDHTFWSGFKDIFYTVTSGTIFLVAIVQLINVLDK